MPGRRAHCHRHGRRPPPRRQLARPHQHERSLPRRRRMGGLLPAIDAILCAGSFILPSSRNTELAGDGDPFIASLRSLLEAPQLSSLRNSAPGAPRWASPTTTPPSPNPRGPTSLCPHRPLHPSPPCWLRPSPLSRRPSPPLRSASVLRPLPWSKSVPWASP